MELVIIVISLALIEYIIFSMLVGKARGDYNVDAPATSGKIGRASCRERVLRLV